MGKFLAYLNEGRTRTISADTAFFNITNNCSKNYKKMFNSISSIKIYRGVYYEEDFGYVDSNKGQERVSANTDNYYTLLIDNLPSGKTYPKRSRGLVCTTDPDYTKNYGHTFYIIPYDDAKIGICPSFDFGESFHNKEFWKYFADLDQLNDIISRLILRPLHTKSPRTYEQLKDILIQISELPEDSFKNIRDRYYEFFNKKDIIKHLNDVLDPKKNGFKMGIENLKKEREVGIQGESILLSRNGYSMLMEDLYEHFGG